MEIILWVNLRMGSRYAFPFPSLCLWDSKDFSSICLPKTALLLFSSWQSFKGKKTVSMCQICYNWIRRTVWFRIWYYKASVEIHLRLVLQRIFIILFANCLIPISSPCLSIDSEIRQQKMYYVVIPTCQLTIAIILHKKRTTKSQWHKSNEQHLFHSYIHWSVDVALVCVCSFWGPGKKKSSSYPKEALPTIRAEMQRCKRSNPYLQVHFNFLSALHPLASHRPKQKKSGKDTQL